jgi:uncharacterized protein YdeI (YjbR/CyaY-like superfamily)
MESAKIKSGTVHNAPEDLKKVLLSQNQILENWNDLTPLARNEWICWIISPKKEETRVIRLTRTKEDLLKGKRRPCCWAGCIHR